MTIADSRVVGFLTLNALNALKVCSSDEHNGYAYLWMRRTTDDSIPLVRESLLAEAESAANNLHTNLIAAYAERDALKSRLDAVERLAADWQKRVYLGYGLHDRLTDEQRQTMQENANELRAALGGESRGGGEVRK